ncbi:hypothetical protein SDC9_193539 [bioreactor metagenome]|uniref:Uncharacterized protein n=1 Tax=bioreactor metagenome TaxID=1076179 RepID=A0A645I4B9_9ZZZZ
MAGADVAEIARRHAERHLLVVGRGGLEVAFEVIHHLGRNARPVDRIDRTDLVLCLEFEIVGHRLDDVLSIVKHAGHGNVEDVFILQ